MQRRIFRLVASNVACWGPVTVMALLKLGGVRIGKEVYAVAAIVLLPINSALNPILYANVFDVIRKCCAAKPGGAVAMTTSEAPTTSIRVTTTKQSRVWKERFDSRRPRAFRDTPVWCVFCWGSVLSVDVVCCFETRVTPHVSESCTKRTCFSHARHWWARSSEGFSRGGGFYFTNSKLREKQFSTKKQMTKYQISKPMGAVVPPSPPENFPETSSVEPRFNPKSSNRPAARFLKRYRDGRGVTRGGAKGAHCFGRRKVPTMWYVLPSIQYICSKRPQIRTWGP